MTLNYSLQRNYTFRSLLAHGRAGSRYVTVQLGGLVMNSALLELLLGQRLLDASLGLGLSASGPSLALLPWSTLRVLIAQGISLGVTTVYSYVAQRTWVFGRPIRD
jgi:putative flippase GtrA